MFKQMKLVAGQVYRIKIKTPSFWLAVLTPLLIPIVMFAVGFIIAKTSDDAAPKLAVVDNPVLAQTIKSGKLLDADIIEVSDVDTAKKKIISDKLDGYLVKKDDSYTLVTSTDGTMKFTEGTVRTALSQIELADKASQLKLSAQELASLQQPAELTMKTLSDKGETDGGAGKNVANSAISLAVTIVIFTLLMVYTNMIAQEIANEKSSRIMETLLAATSAKVQYYRKIMGIGLLVLTHILFYVVLGVGASVILKDNKMVKGVLEMVKGVDSNFLIFSVLMLVVGLLSYLFLTAIIASLINDQSQVQQAVQPIVFLSMIGYMAGIVGGTVPNNVVLKGLSFIPFVSTTLMPSRLATEVSTLTSAYIALAIQALALIVVAKFGERIYAKNVLSYSDEKIFKQFVQNLKK
ncbi:MAG: ABC transporter permease [Pseudolactococcus laudensis]